MPSVSRLENFFRSWSSNEAFSLSKIVYILIFGKFSSFCENAGKKELYRIWEKTPDRNASFEDANSFIHSKIIYAEYSEAKNFFSKYSSSKIILKKGHLTPKSNSWILYFVLNYIADTLMMFNTLDKLSFQFLKSINFLG